VKKQILLIIVFVILSFNVFAQIVPDDNFREEINDKLGQPANYQPTIADLNSLTGDLEASLVSIQSIEGAQYLINITHLYLDNNQISDVSALSGLTNLVWLHLENNQISDISALSNLTNLTYLYLYNNQISDILALSSLTNLTHVRLDNNQIIDISALSSLTNLIRLYLNDNQIVGISALSSMTNLTYLYLHNNQIVDISELSSLTNLYWLELNENQIIDISALSSLTSLERLELHTNQIIDICTLSNLTNLSVLYLHNNQIVGISALSGLTNLVWLTLCNNQIIDISALSNMTSLTYLILNNNQIVDISALSVLTNLEWLDLSANQINDISALSYLTNLDYLYLQDNEITDIYPLVENTGLESYDSLMLENYQGSNPLSIEAIEVHVPILISIYFHWWLNFPNVPNLNAACYPNPARNETGLTVNTNLVWRGNDPTLAATYEVWLGETNEELENVGNGIAINDTLYSFTPTLNENTNYWWRIRTITDNDTLWSGLWHFAVGNPISNDDEYILLNTNKIIGNHPNPFNPTTTIEYIINEQGYTKIEVFNMKGQLVNSLVNQNKIEGTHSVIWFGDDFHQSKVSSGLYFYQLRNNGKICSVKKCVLLK
jgi:Leucine-rich repeat (LRR) protein